MGLREGPGRAERASVDSNFVRSMKTSDLIEEPSRTDEPKKETTAGNYFVSNYPPFSFWKPEQVGELYAALERPPVPGTPLGVYLHIPFCRKRCHFCYFKVYTD